VLQAQGVSPKREYAKYLNNLKEVSTNSLGDGSFSSLAADACMPLSVSTARTSIIKKKKLFNDQQAGMLTNRV
jgi:hypothetical protein